MTTSNLFVQITHFENLSMLLKIRVKINSNYWWLHTEIQLHWDNIIRMNV